jgi:hypothetical protein
VGKRVNQFRIGQPVWVVNFDIGGEAFIEGQATLLSGPASGCRYKVQFLDEPGVFTRVHLFLNSTKALEFVNKANKETTNVNKIT